MSGPCPGWPLSPVEELDWYLENPGEPSLVHLEAHIRGGLDRGALERALAIAVAADPASRRRLAASSGWRRRPRWDVTPGAVPPVRMVTWADPDELDALRESLTTVPIPLDSCVARLTLAVGPGRDVLFLQVHHAAFDGVSALALLSAIGDAYRRLAPAAPRPALTPDDSGDVNAYPGATAMTSARARQPRGAGSRSRLPGAVARVAPGRNGPARPGYGFAQWTAPVPAVPAPAVPAPRPGDTGGSPGNQPRPTVNDLLITALCLAVYRWNGRRPGGRISVCVPVNTREAGSRWNGPGNQSRLIRVVAGPGDCGHPFALLARVSEQTRKAREHPSPGLDETSRLLAAGWAPAGLKRTAVRLVRRLASPLVTDTALVSNLGVLPSPPAFTDGSAPVWFCGPAPMPRGIGIGVLTVSGRLHVTLVYSRALLDGPSAADFAALFRVALAELAPEQQRARPARREEREREAS